MAATASAQFKKGGTEPEQTKTGQEQVTRWRVGMFIKATGGPCHGITGYAPVPTDWPEQEVSVIEEEVSPEAKIHYEIVDGGVKIMNVKVGQLAAGKEVKALVTVEVRRRKVLPPKKPTSMCFPIPRSFRTRFAPISIPARKSKAAIRRSAIWPRRSAPTRKRRGTRSRQYTTGFASM